MTWCVMLDDDDAMDFALLGPGGLIGAVILILIVIAVYTNHGECEQRSCPGAQKPELVDHRCLCVTEAK